MSTWIETIGPCECCGPPEPWTCEELSEYETLYLSFEHPCFGPVSIELNKTTGPAWHGTQNAGDPNSTVCNWFEPEEPFWSIEVSLWCDGEGLSGQMDVFTNVGPRATYRLGYDVDPESEAHPFPIHSSVVDFDLPFHWDKHPAVTCQTEECLESDEDFLEVHVTE